MADIQVSCQQTDNGWTCDVTVVENSDQSSHTVTVPRSDYDTLAEGRTDVESLVEESFEFLLEREPKESILGQFDIMTIQRYFPEYPERIGDRL